VVGKADTRMQLLGEWYSKLQQIATKLNAISRKYDVSFEQFLVIEQIIEEERKSPSELAVFFKTSLPAVSRKLNLLQSKRLVYKIRGEQDDQRLMRVNATPEGIETYESIKAELLTWDAQLKDHDINLMAMVNHTLEHAN